MKKIIFVTQSKGGSGKSVLTFLLAEKYPDATVFDMDDATKTTTLQLAYRNPKEISFLSSNNVIDRGVMSEFFEAISQSTRNFFIGDHGASISEQLPYYFNEVQGALSAILKELGVNLELYVVVGGANMFKQTIGYLDTLVKAVNGDFPIKIFKNEFFEFTQDQNNQLKEYANLVGLEIVPFNISKDKNESTQNRISEVLKSGKGVENANQFSQMYFKRALNEIAIP